VFRFVSGEKANYSVATMCRVSSPASVAPQPSGDLPPTLSQHNPAEGADEGRPQPRDRRDARRGGRQGPHARPPKPGGEEIVEIEAFLLAVVAIATAWSGYQGARWDGRQAELYGEASTIRVRADQLLTLGGQHRLLDVSTFNTWIEARNEGRTELAALYARRFSPEFNVAFDAWLVTDPFSNPSAPPGPSFMRDCVNPQIERGSEMNERATQTFDNGTAARSRADDYIRTTVVLATVLFLVALSQRFRIRRVCIGVLGGWTDDLRTRDDPHVPPPVSRVTESKGGPIGKVRLANATVKHRWIHRQ
jgi:hypothetical protein